MPPNFLASIAVEGDPDEIVARRLVDLAGGEVTDVYGKQGDDFIRERITGYNAAAKFSPWFVLVDLDLKADCAPELRREWLPTSATGLCFRIAVRSIEAWFMADGEKLASFLRVSRDHIPVDVEGVRRPKQRMISIVRESNSRRIREDMIPQPGSGRNQGRLYPARLSEFARDHWRPEVAADNCDSLSRAISCLEDLEGP